MSNPKSPFREPHEPTVIDATPPWKRLVDILSLDEKTTVALANRQDLAINPFTMDVVPDQDTTGAEHHSAVEPTGNGPAAS